MTALDLLSLLPLVVLSAGSVVMLLAAAFWRKQGVSAVLAVAVFTLGLAALPVAARLGPWPVKLKPLLILDSYSFFYMGLLFAAGLVVAALSEGYLSRKEGNHEEFHVLLVLATLGGAFLCAASHFVSLFLGLELMSVSLYALIGYLRFNERSLEAALKYLILASTSAAFLLFGLALIYAHSGTMDLEALGRTLREGSLPGATRDLFLAGGMCLVLVGVGFKLAVVPFHLWTPDVYQGAPAPVTAFVATASKGAMLALFLRYFLPAGPEAQGILGPVITLIAAASMIAGNILALMQTNVKRILAYSSIAHLGYILVAFQAGGAEAVRTVNFYIAAYFVTTLAAFGVVTILSGPERDAELLEDYRGLLWRKPSLGIVMAAALLSLSGIPLTAGFLGKFLVVRSGVGSSLWVLLFILAASSAIGIYYYLRILVQLFLPPAAERVEKDRVPALTVSWRDRLVLAALLLALVWIGAWPGPFLDLVRTTAQSVGQ